MRCTQCYVSHHGSWSSTHRRLANIATPNPIHVMPGISYTAELSPDPDPMAYEHEAAAAPTPKSSVN